MPAVYLAHHPDGTVEQLIYEYEEDLVRDFIDRPEVTIIRVHATGAETLFCKSGDWEDVPRVEA